MNLIGRPFIAPNPDSSNKRSLDAEKKTNNNGNKTVLSEGHSSTMVDCQAIW